MYLLWLDRFLLHDAPTKPAAMVLLPSLEGCEVYSMTTGGRNMNEETH